MPPPERYRTLLDESRDKIAVVDEDGSYLYLNGAVQRLLGYDPAELVGENALDHVHPDDRERVEARFRAVADGSEPSTGIEYRFRAKDGSYVWLESRMTDHRTTELGGYVVSSRDVTDRRRAEEARRETEARLEEIATNTTEVLWMFTADWDKLLFVNDAFEELWGMAVETLREDSRAFLECVHPEDRERVERAMDALSAGQPVDIEYRVNPGEDFRRWMEVRGTPISEGGEVVRVVGFARDVTERKRRERHLQVVDRLLRHNLRNDLNVVTGNVDAALRGGDVEVFLPVALAHCASLLETAEAERTIVSLLTDGSVREPVNASALVRSLAADVSTAVPPAVVTCDVQDGLWLTGVPAIERAVEELLENALTYADTDPPEVGVSARRDGDAVEIAVRNPGPPFPAEEADVLLSGSERGQLSHGTGLGLWLVYWAVELSNGSVTVERTAGENVVRLSLPAVDGDAVT